MKLASKIIHIYKKGWLPILKPRPGAQVKNLPIYVVYLSKNTVITDYYAVLCCMCRHIHKNT